MNGSATPATRPEVGHDFNNLLTAILGNVELMAGMLDDPARSTADLRASLEQIERAARRAVDLARAIEGAPADDGLCASVEEPPRGTILVCEDEELVRVVAAKVLAASGYEVLAACGAEEAMTLARTHGGPIDLLVTDVVMPGVGGRALFERFAALRPGTPVLYVSGYPAEAMGEDAHLDAGVELLEKPFSPTALLRRVQRALT